LHIDGASSTSRHASTWKEQVVGQKQMATIGQVAATVSHELRNPLGAISNSMAFPAADDGQSAARHREALDASTATSSAANHHLRPAGIYEQKELSVPHADRGPG